MNNTPSLQELKEKLSSIKEYENLVKSILNHKSARPVLKNGFYDREDNAFFEGAKLIKGLIQDRLYETIAKIEMIEHPARLTKPISEMSDEELQLHNERASALQEKRKASLPDNLTPHPTPQEELATFKEPSESIKIIKTLEDKYGIGKGVDLSAKYVVRDVGYVFDRIPENNDAMDQLRKNNYQSGLAFHGENYNPCTYLCVSYHPDKFSEAVSILSADLRLLAKDDFIFGNLSTPKVLELDVIKKHALYCWPFVDLFSLAKNSGKDYVKDFDCNPEKLLTFLGIKTVCSEGKLGFKIP